MALISQKLVNSRDEADYENPEFLILEAPGAAPLRIRVEDTHKGESDRIVEVTLWGAKLKAYLVGKETDEWISSVLGRPCHLVTLISTQEHYRPLSRTYDKNPVKANIHAAWSDGYPMLLATTRSFDSILENYNQIKEKLKSEGKIQERSEEEEKGNENKKKFNVDVIPTINRFRPNIIVSGDLLQPWAEDRWKHINIAGIDLRVVKACARCSIPDIEHTDGGRDPNFLMTKTLKAIRSSKILGGTPNEVFFGQNLIQHPNAIGQVLRVGDEVTILGEGRARYP